MHQSIHALPAQIQTLRLTHSFLNRKGQTLAEDEQTVRYGEDHAREIATQLGYNVASVYHSRATIQGKAIDIFVIHTQSFDEKDDEGGTAVLIVRNDTGEHYPPEHFWQNIAVSVLSGPLLTIHPPYAGRNLLYYPPCEEG